MKITIARSLVIFGLVVMTGLLSAVGILNYALEELKIDGPKYDRIVDAKDLIADILPPPMFVVEAYMLALEAAEDPALMQSHVKRLAEMQSEYRTRLAYWRQSGLPADMKSFVLDDLAKATDRFWTEMDANFLAKLDDGDAAALRERLHAMRELYRAQKMSVEKLVAMADAFRIKSEQDARTGAFWLKSISYALSALAVLLLLAGLFTFRRRAVVPVTAIADYMTVLARGNYDTPVPYARRSDEIGTMSAAVAVFRDLGIERMRLEAEARIQDDMTGRERAARLAEQERYAANLQKVVADLGAGLQRLSQCNIRLTLDEPFEGGFEVLRTDFNNSLAVFQEALVQVLGKADEINRSCGEMRGSADQLSTRTEQQAAALEQTAAALEQISTNVRNSAERADHTRARARNARDNVVKSSSVVQDAVAAMQRIEEASRQIGTITSVIDEIAFQTNLLALNAGVEAARAGEAGKGFAVVAQEVRELAQRSAKAAKEISGLIGKSNMEVAGGVVLVRDTGTALAAIEGYITEISTDIDAIAMATQEQSVGLGEVNHAINQMDQITQQNAAMVEETAAATHALADDATQLSELVNRFQLNRRLAVRDRDEDRSRTAMRQRTDDMAYRAA